VITLHLIIPAALPMIEIAAGENITVKDM